LDIADLEAKDLLQHDMIAQLIQLFHNFTEISHGSLYLLQVIEFDTPSALLANENSVFSQMVAVQDSQKHAVQT